MSSMSLFSEIEHINASAHLDNESFTAMFGSITVDLTRQPLAPGDHTISAFAMFGEVTIRVPAHVGLRVDGGALMGETRQEWRTADNRLLSSADLPEFGFETAPVRLRTTATAIFGSARIVRVAGIQAQELAAETLSPDITGSYEGETRRIASL
jgi:predicted membrane protein